MKRQWHLKFCIHIINMRSRQILNQLTNFPIVPCKFTVHVVLFPRSNAMTVDPEEAIILTYSPILKHFLRRNYNKNLQTSDHM